MANVNATANAILGLSIQTQDLLSNLAPTLVTRTVSGLVFSSQYTTYDAYLIVPSVATANLVPNPGVSFASVVLIRNLGTGPFQINVTFTSGGTASPNLYPNGFFFYFSTPATNLGATPTGVSTVTVQQAGVANVPAEIFIAV